MSAPDFSHRPTPAALAEIVVQAVDRVTFLTVAGKVALSSVVIGVVAPLENEVRQLALELAVESAGHALAKAELETLRVERDAALARLVELEGDDEATI